MQTESQCLRLRANLKANARRSSLGVIDSLGAGLDVRADAMVVTRRERVKVTETVDGDSVVGCREASSEGIARDFALGHVIGRLTTDEKPITAENSVCSESGTLNENMRKDVLATLKIWMELTLKTSRAARE